MANAIDYIARSEIKKKGGFVDYSTLKIKHLGSVYEGLLEYKLEIAKEQMVVKGGQKSRKWVKLKEYNKKLKKKKPFIKFKRFDRANLGDIYLSTDKGERKSTGSYYTPDEIVNFIIKNTLEPLIEEKWKEARENKKSLIDATLSLKILDPAMGSGHFLIGALEFLSSKLLEATQNDLETELVEDVGLFTPDWAKRKVLSRCIYGVDLNDMAVELTKLSLWLTTISKEKPLIFLDHKLKQGNSLIGTYLEDIVLHPFDKNKTQSGLQIPQNFIKTLVEKMNGVLVIDDDTKLNLKLKEDAYEVFKNAIEYDKLKTLADIRTSIYYNNKLDSNSYKDFLEKTFNSSPNDWDALKEETFLKKGCEIAKKKKFFHWEIEFPDVFLKDEQEPKFDVIIGNPPWASIRGKHRSNMFDDSDILFIENRFPENTYMPNSYEFFIVQSLKLLVKGGFHSFIVPDRLGFNASLEYLRDIFLNQYSLIILLYKMPFPEVIADTLIYILRGKEPEENHKISVTDYGEETVLIPNSFYKEVGDKAFLYFRNKTILDIIEKIDNSPNNPLDNIAKTTSGCGAKSELVTETRINPNQIHVFKGSDIIRYAMIGYHYFEFKNENLTGRTRDKNKLGAIPKVLLRKTGDPLYAAYDDNGTYPEQSAYFLYDFNEDYSPFYLLAILNSIVFKFYYTEKIVTNRDSTPQLKKIHLDKFPIRSVNFTTASNLYTAQVDNTQQLFQDYLSSDDPQPILIFIKSLLPKNQNGTFITKQEKSDIVHDILIFLVKNNINMNNKKIKESKGFIEYCEREIKVSFNILTNRTNLKQYYNLKFNEFLDILKENKKKIPQNLSNRAFQDSLKDEFEKSLEIISPLKNKTKAIDRLIDQIVCMLYGLNDDEIKIIESGYN